MLMPWRVQQFNDGIIVDFFKELFADGSLIGNGYADEFISFAILTFTSFEETREECRFFRISFLFEGGVDLLEGLFSLSLIFFFVIAVEEG